MNKQNSTDIIWYDKNVYNAIMALDEQHPNVIPIFGGALGAFNALEVGDIDRFEALMSNAVDNAKFYKWHESSAEVARRFCTICMVDPALIEAGFGMRFEDVFAHGLL